jgi:hypothetical protein
MVTQAPVGPDENWGGGMTETTSTTEITIVGANCPWCLDETLDLLRREPGVVSVDANIADECLRVRHRDVAVDRLLAVIRGHLLADDTSSAEHVMVEIDPAVADLHCTHHRRHAREASDV